MSRSGYTGDCDGFALVRWRGAVERAIRGKRGQALLREMAAALDAMPEKRLIAGKLEQDGEVCALGAVGRARGLTMPTLDPEDDYKQRHILARMFDIAPAMAAEITYMNDEAWPSQAAEERWARMRKWMEGEIR